MKKRVYDYICCHPDASIHDIASAIDKPEMEVLNIVNALDREGYIRRVYYLKSNGSAQPGEF